MTKVHLQKVFAGKNTPEQKIKTLEARIRVLEKALLALENDYNKLKGKK
jgi:hypothetical protein